jgi:hypothetical protein
VLPGLKVNNVKQGIDKEAFAIGHAIGVALFPLTSREAINADAR